MVEKEAKNGGDNAKVEEEEESKYAEVEEEEEEEDVAENEKKKEVETRTRTKRRDAERGGGEGDKLKRYLCLNSDLNGIPILLRHGKKRLSKRGTIMMINNGFNTCNIHAPTYNL